MSSQPKTYQFQAEISKLLDIVINSLYKNQDIFLRELISNASDATDKRRFKSLTSAETISDPLEISVSYDKDKKTVSISDNGIGMTEEELKLNLGTLGKSGSQDFLNQLTKSMKNNSDIDNSIIGRFGVGFYSAFIVAENVSVKTRHIDSDNAFEWQSTGVGEFSITPISKDSIGTQITITLKENALHYLDDSKLKSIIKQYSNFVGYPITLGEERINEVQALWTKSKSDISEKEYNEFYKFIANDFSDPMHHLHFTSDAPIQLSSILFIPSTNQESLGWGKIEPGLNLYSRKVLIDNECKDVLPPYLRFVRGVVDCEDLPLNVSRETVQNSLLLSKIKTNLTRKVLSFLDDTSRKQKSDYIKIWKTFGNIIREGISVDPDNKSRVAKLLRFTTSQSKGKDDLISLKDYVNRKKDDQKEIYFLFSQDEETAKRSPQVELFLKKDIEVIFLFDPVDEILFNDVSKFNDLPIKSVDQADTSFIQSLTNGDTKDEKKETPDKEKVNDFVGYLKDILKDHVTDVKVSNRLVNSPCCLVANENDPTAGMQRLMKMMNQASMPVKRILEINPDNDLIKNLMLLHENNTDNALLNECCHQLYDNTLCMDEMQTDIKVMVPRIQSIMERSVAWVLDKNKPSKIIHPY